MNAQKIMKRLEEKGFACYMVGGAVRDHLMGLNLRDIDLATSAKPEELAEIFKDTKVDFFGRRFAVTSINGIEVATFRGESYQSPGKPQVHFLDSFKEDAARRDFTINSMAMDLEGHIIDFHEGQDDLAQGQIKTVGKAQLRFAEDPIRVLRGIYFACRFDFTIEAKTLRAMSASQKDLLTIPKERIGKEAIKALEIQALTCWLKRIEKISLLESVLPELAHLPGKEQNPKYHHLDVWEHTLAVLLHCESSEPRDQILILAALFHDCAKGLPEIRTYSEETSYPSDQGHELLGPEISDQVLRQWGLGKKARKDIGLLIRHHMWLPEDLKTASIVNYLNPMAEDFSNLEDFELFLKRLKILKKGDIIGKNPDNLQADIKYLNEVFDRIFIILQHIPFFRSQTSIDPRAFPEEGLALKRRLAEELSLCQRLKIEEYDKNNI